MVKNIYFKRVKITELGKFVLLMFGRNIIVEYNSASQFMQYLGFVATLKEPENSTFKIKYL